MKTSAAECIRPIQHKGWSWLAEENWNCSRIRDGVLLSPQCFPVLQEENAFIFNLSSVYQTPENLSVLREKEVLTSVEKKWVQKDSSATLL